MPNPVIALAAEIVKQAGRTLPADALLRSKLKSARGLPRTSASRVSATVFAYFRWLGWLEPNNSIENQLEQAVKLDRRFYDDPQSIPDSDLNLAVPHWLAQQVKISPEWLRTLQTPPPLWLRAKAGTGRGLAEKLGNCWVLGNGELSDALRYEGTEDLFRAPEFHAGEFELQDIGSQAVGWICAPQPGETWWDACAGEGGKMLHLSDLMENQGLLWASDRAEWRLKKLKLRAARAKAFNYRTALWDGGAKLPTKTKFDGILVDAPCSGIGTWQRNPQARWTTSCNDVIELCAVQKNLLANVAGSLKPGGKLIYSVCTLSRAETVAVAVAFEEIFREMQPLEFSNPLQPAHAPVTRLWLWPQDMNGNGMFICGWRKTV
jgi:16S rRNA (cytosine967-C5)-methyltransferase